MRNLAPGLVLVWGAMGQSGPMRFYETRVRPVLSAKCYGCHTQKAEGRLRLDSREAVTAGGKSGPAAIPGQGAESLLYRAVAHTPGRIAMPPGGRLTEQEIADLRKWIDDGIHMPGAALKSPDGAKHWSLLPPVKSTPPRIRDERWIRTPLDRFVLAQLEKQGLRPAPPADKRIWLRRVTLDVWGLPPTPAEYREFELDRSPEAFARIVDRLLGSARYGERWARHWLDVARYADYDVLGLSADPFPNAWRYRDWVIDALNADMPYHQFVKAQLAGDLIDRSLTPGLGFLALGPWYYKIVEPPKARADELQDRIDVVSRGLLGLTVACARCHDHKYDPIPQRDYYALGGVLTSLDYKEVPLASGEVVDAYHRAESRIGDLERRIRELLDADRERVSSRLAAEAGRYVSAVWFRGQGAPAPAMDAAVLERWSNYLGRSHDHPYLDFWRTIRNAGQAETAARQFQHTVDLLVEEHRELTAYNKRVIEESKKSTDPYDIFCKGCRAETRALPRNKYIFWGDLFEPRRRTDGESREAGVLYFDDGQILAYLDSRRRAELDGLREELKRAKAALPKKYPFLHAMADAKEPRDMLLNKRGDPYNLGEAVPRRFLSALGAAPLGEGSGRMALANAIASRQNPLTARVAVNRIWHHHFGAGIVRSVSNLGVAGDQPSHPELLDYLALEFMENGWSQKKLHRTILLSATYAMGGAFNPADPDNRRLSRYARQRLDVEALRDSMLLVAGELDFEGGGPASKWDAEFRRRTVYGEVNRFRLERLLTLFDFPDPAIHAEKRVPTNTAVQRLFFLNSDFVARRAQALARRIGGAGEADRLEFAYRLLFGRPPEAREREAAESFLGGQPGEAEEAWAELAQALLSSNEFCFVD